jgi:hypothetical protein
MCSAAANLPDVFASKRGRLASLSGPNTPIAFVWKSNVDSSATRRQSACRGVSMSAANALNKNMTIVRRQKLDIRP